MWEGGLVGGWEEGEEREKKKSLSITTDTNLQVLQTSSRQTHLQEQLHFKYQRTGSTAGAVQHLTNTWCTTPDKDQCQGC